MMNANEMFEAVHYGQGIKNSKACVLEINMDVSTLEGSTTPKYQFFSLWSILSNVQEVS